MHLLWGIFALCLLAVRPVYATPFDDFVLGQPLSTTLQPTDSMPVVQGGETRQVFPAAVFMRWDGANASLPDARTNLGLGTASDVTFNSLMIGGAFTSRAPLTILTNPSTVAVGYIHGIKVGIGDGTDPAWTSNPQAGDFVPLYSYVNSLNGRNRIWASNPVTEVYSGNDATAWGMEVNLNNSSSEVSTPNTTLQKTGLSFVSGGLKRVTMGVHSTASSADGSNWNYNGLVISRAVNYGLWFHGIGGDSINPFGIASIYDDSNSATILKAIGTHTSGIDLSGATISGNAFASPGFSITGAGNALVNNLSLPGNVLFVSNTGGPGYTSISDGSGVAAVILLGPTGDPTNYHDRTSHAFRSGGGGTVFATINATGINTAVGGSFGTGTNYSLVIGKAANNAPIYSVANTSGTYPPSATTSFAITDHFAAQREVDFFNNDTLAAVSYAFYQKTGASAATLLATISPTGDLGIGGALNAVGTVTGARLGVGNITSWANNETCVAGQIMIDASFIYACTATNTVKRSALSAF